MSDRAKQALFNILGPDVEGKPFLDVFAGSGAVGFEALSRGASDVTFVESDKNATQSIQKYAKQFGVERSIRILYVDAYRWADKGAIPRDPVNIFLGPPYPHFQNRGELLLAVLTVLQKRTAPGSNIAIQADEHIDWTTILPNAAQWDTRAYGRNCIAIWKHPLTEAAPLANEGIASEPAQPANS